MSDTEIIEWTQPLPEIFTEPPTRNVYYCWTPEYPDVWLAHYCLNLRHEGMIPKPRWHAAGTGNHQLVSREPLHIEPSIGWMECCGRHGWIRGGLWVPCPPDLGWQSS